MTQTSRLSTRKKVLFLAATLVVLLLVFEVGARLFFFVAEGANPYYLTYGFIPDIEWHSAEYDGYTKFQPSSRMHQKIPGETIVIEINSDGFRSTYDFARPKPANVFRIATLGASSTFGYYNHDDETYPYRLQELLSEARPDLKIEVANMGIPHFRLSNILALAKHELISLEPDVVTLYTGFANATRIRPPELETGLYSFKDWLLFHSVGWRTVHPLAVTTYHKLSAVLNRDLVGLPNLSLPVVLDEKRINKNRENVRREFRAQLDSLAHIVDSIGADLVLVTQNYNTRFFPWPDSPTRQRSYHEAVAEVEELLEKKRGVLARLSTLLIHNDLMEELRSSADKRGLTVVEGIDVLAGDQRELMISDVHPSPKGNARLAPALRDAILEADLMPAALLASQ